VGVDSYGKIISGIQLVPHAFREESRTLHAFENLVSCVVIEYVTWWICAIRWTLWLYELGEDAYMLIFDILVMLVHLVILIVDDSFA